MYEKARMIMIMVWTVYDGLWTIDAWLGSTISISVFALDGSRAAADKDRPEYGKLVWNARHGLFKLARLR